MTVSLSQKSPVAAQSVTVVACLAALSVSSSVHSTQLSLMVDYFRSFSFFIDLDAICFSDQSTH